MIDQLAYALALYTLARWAVLMIRAAINWNDRRDVQRAWDASQAKRRGAQRNPRYSPAGLATFGPAHE